MSAQALLAQLVYDLEGDGLHLIALDIRKRAERFLCDRDDSEAAVIGVIALSDCETRRLKEAA